MPSFRTDGRTGGCAQRAHGLAGDAGREREEGQSDEADGASLARLGGCDSVREAAGTKKSAARSDTRTARRRQGRDRSVPTIML